jgi:hypothetical protein
MGCNQFIIVVYIPAIGQGRMMEMECIIKVEMDGSQ